MNYIVIAAWLVSCGGGTDDYYCTQFRNMSGAFPWAQMSDCWTQAEKLQKDNDTRGGIRTFTCIAVKDAQNETTRHKR